MNRIPDDDLPDWALAICEKYRLHERSDEPIAGLSVLLLDAAHDLREAALTIFREDAATPDSVRSATVAATMVKDALALATICRDRTSPGVLEQQPDGSYIRRPLPHSEG
jgi:hypothetical protein